MDVHAVRIGTPTYVNTPMCINQGREADWCSLSASSRLMLLDSVGRREKGELSIHCSVLFRR